MPQRLSQPEFIAMMAMIFATIAFSIDAMLPALPEIGAELTADDPNRAQLILTVFIAAMGIGTLFTGPLSDALGRRPVILGGSALYIIGALLVYVAPTLELVLAARFLQGLGVAGPRAVGMAVVRDLYSGRDMARISSFIMMVFTLVPAMAPLIGEQIIAQADWRGIFLAFVVFSVISVGWFTARQGETLMPERRRPFRPGALWAGLREVMGHPLVRASVLLQILSFGCLFTLLSTVQPIYDQSYDRAASFPEWFMVVSLIAGTSSLLNAWAVSRFGIRPVLLATFSVQIVLSGLVALLSALSGTPVFAVFLLWQISIFFQAGLTIGNINALGLEPMGHIAGMAASLISSLATLGAALLAIPVGLSFDGTPLRIAAWVCAFSIVALGLVLRLPRSPLAAVSDARPDPTPADGAV